MLKRLLLLLAVVFVLFSTHPIAVSAQGTTTGAQISQQEVVNKACRAKQPGDTFVRNPAEQVANVTIVCNASLADPAYPNAWKSQLNFIRSYCYSGWCRFPGQVTGVRYSGAAIIPQIKELNEAQDSDAPNLYTLADGQWKALNTMFLKYTACEPVGITECPKDSNGQSTSLYNSMTSVIAGMYREPPANTQTYVADVMRNMNFGAEPAYAQGIGFSALQPVLNTWKIFRNIAYFFFVVVMVVIGFMIMFRQKIGSQAVVTAQQALPQIVIALLAVTFSYAIAGLLIDLMYLSMYAIASIFGASGINTAEIINLNSIGIGSYLINSNAAGTGANAISVFVYQAFGENVLSAVLGLLSGLSAAVAILIVVLFNTFQIFFKLLKLYIEIILSIVFAPIILMIGAFPGQNTLGPWIRDIVASLAVFPSILIFLIIFKVLSDSGGAAFGVGFTPPFLVTGGAGILPFLAGLGLILSLPKAIDEIPKALGKKGGGLFAGIVEAGYKNLTKTAGAAIPFGTAAVPAALSLRESIKQVKEAGPKDRREKINTILRGKPIVNAEGKVIGMNGGILNSAAKGFAVGQTVRKYIQRTAEGRLTDPEDAQQYLAKLVKGQSPKKDDDGAQKRPPEKA